MNGDRLYDVAIAGGGLAGLTLAIQLSRFGHDVVLIEKETYPFHRVCGEYISLESWDFLTELGLDLPALDVSVIKKLSLSANNGKTIEQALPLGGFGISRYHLDAQLVAIARKMGVTVLENTKLLDIAFEKEEFIAETSAGNIRAKVGCGSFGKRSNLDLKWKRPFSAAAKNKLNNYIGVKYHIRGNFPEDIIELHNFRNGYCGLVKIEKDLYNLCYLTTAENLKNHHGDISKMEEELLGRNPHLKNIFSNAEKVNGPLTISQVSFARKSQVENHVLMIGDAAGMITPLCGNGMSMAMRGSKIASNYIHLFLEGKLSRETMEQSYINEWRNVFSARLRTGRRIQRLFSYPVLTKWVIQMLQPFPFFLRTIIRKTHGKPF